MTLLFNQKTDKSKRVYLRQNMTPAERILWQEVRNKRLGFKVRRQFGIGPFVVDFYIPTIRLVVELDGGHHQEAAEQDYDQERAALMQHLGIETIRFTNEQVIRNTPKVLAEIMGAADRLSFK